MPNFPKTIISPARNRPIKHGSVLWLAVRKSIPAFVARPLRQRFRRQRAPSFMIDPETKHKMSWDIVVTCCVLYTTCVVPYRVCFKRDATGNFATFESVLDLFFFVDIILNFITGIYLPSGEVTYEGKVIARSYLRGWFFVDFFSTLPFDDLAGWFGAPADAKASKALASAKLLRSLKVLRLFKIARIRKLSKMFGSLEDGVYTNQSLLSLCKLVLTMLFLSHLVACLWFAIGNSPPAEGESTWVYAYAFQDQEPVLQYLVSVYWAIVTMVTIGYGDVLARNNFERVFNIVIMAIGVSFFGYVVGTITSLVSNLDVAASLYEERLTVVKEYVISRAIPKYMSKRIRDHFEYYYQNRSVFKEKTILSRLPSAMRNEMIHHVHAKVVANVQYFSQCHESLISAIVLCMRPFNVLRDEYVYVQHEIAAHVFFLLKGKINLTKAVTVAMAKGKAPGGEWRLATLGVGEHFGELEVYDHEHGNGVRICSAIAKSYCELTFLSRQAISKISANWPEVLRHFRDAAKQSSKRLRRRVVNPRALNERMDDDDDCGEEEDEDDASDEANRATNKLFQDDEMESKMMSSTLLARKTILSNMRKPHVSSRVSPFRSSSTDELIKSSSGATDNRRSDNVVAMTSQAKSLPEQKPTSVGRATVVTDGFVMLSTAASVKASSLRSPRQRSTRHEEASGPSVPSSGLAQSIVTPTPQASKDRPSFRGRVVLASLMAEKQTNRATAGQAEPFADFGTAAHYVAPQQPPIEIVTSSSSKYEPSAILQDRNCGDDVELLASASPDPSPSPSPSSRGERKRRLRGTDGLQIEEEVDGIVEDDADDDDDDDNSAHSSGADTKPVTLAALATPAENAEVAAVASRLLPKLRPQLAEMASKPGQNVLKDVAVASLAVRRSRQESRRNLSDILAKIRGSSATRAKPNFHSEQALLKGTRIFHPQEHFIITWQFIVGIGILYSIIVVPYRLGFDADAADGWAVLEMIIDCFFAVDIFLNFRTAFYDEERLLIFDQRVIFKRYVRGWFVVDVLSTLPIDEIVKMFFNGGSIHFFPTKLLRLFRIARLLKLARLIKLSRVAGRLRDLIQLSPSTERLLKLLLVMSIFCHWNACAFHAAMLASEGASFPNWCSEFFPIAYPSDTESGGPASSSTSASASSLLPESTLCSDRVGRVDRYLIAVYWAFTTFTTVGYGDIHPSIYSTYELALVITAVVINATVYGYIISAVVTLIKNLDPGDREYRLRMTELKDYLRDSTVSARLGGHIKAHYQHSLASTSLFPEEKLFDKMSPSLRFDIARLVAGETLFAIPLITVMEDSFKGFVSYALFLLKPVFIRRSEKVCRSGGPGMEMFFLVEGKCDLLNSETNEGRIVGENAVFEQYSLMAQPNEIYRTVSTVTAMTKKCVLYSLSIQDFKVLEDVSPAVSTYFLSQLAAVLIEDDLFTLSPLQKINVECALRNGRAFRSVAEQHEKARLSTVSNVAMAKLSLPRRKGSEWTPDLLPRLLKRMDTSEQEELLERHFGGSAGGGDPPHPVGFVSETSEM